MLLSVDPGLNVGLAFRFDNGAWGTLTLKPNANTDVNMGEIIHEILLRKDNLTAVVIESFLGIQMQSSAGIQTMELIGAVRGVCLLLNIPCIKQTPAQRMMQVPTAKAMLTARRKELKNSVSFTDHEVSALSHLLTYERRVARVLSTMAASR